MKTVKALLQVFGIGCCVNVALLLIAAAVNGIIGVLLGVLFGFDFDE